MQTVSAWTTTWSSAEVARLMLEHARCACSTRVGRKFPARPAHGVVRTAMTGRLRSRSKSDHRRGLPRCASRTSFCCSRAPGDLGRRRAGAARLAETELGERGRAVIFAGTAACTEPDIPPSRALRCTPRRLAAGHCARDSRGSDASRRAPPPPSSTATTNPGITTTEVCATPFGGVPGWFARPTTLQKFQ